MELIIFRALYFFSFFGVASIAGMLIPFLQHKGFDPIQIGTLISLYTISGILGQLLAGYLCDKLRTIKKILSLSILFIMISTTISITFKIRVVFYISFIITGFFYSILTNVSDSWVMESEEKIKIKYGSIRAFGSIGWAFGVLVAGFIISKFGYYAVNIMYVISMSVALICSFKLKDSIKESKGSLDFKELLINKEYLFTIIILLIISVSFRAYCQLVPYVIEYRGGNTFSFGIFSFISSLSEIIMLIICGKIMHKFSPDKLLILAPIGILIQSSILYFFTNINIIYFSGIFQIFTFPIMLMVARTMIERLSPNNLKTSSQLIGFAVFNSMGTMIASMLIGYLIENMSVEITITILMILSAIGIVSAIFYDKKIKDKTL